MVFNKGLLVHCLKRFVQIVQNDKITSSFNALLLLSLLKNVHNKVYSSISYLLPVTAHESVGSCSCGSAHPGGAHGGASRPRVTWPSPAGRQAPPETREEPEEETPEGASCGDWQVSVLNILEVKCFHLLLVFFLYKVMYFNFLQISCITTFWK